MPVKILFACLLASALSSCAMPIGRSLELGVHIGDILRTETPAAITKCYEWKATSPLSTRHEHVPCLASWPDELPEGAIRVIEGTMVTVVKIQDLGLVDSASTQVFVKVPGHEQALLVPLGDMGRLFPNRPRHMR